ncbi:hypothetical protein [Lacticaseibacillus pantheris]|nr:hypothetical protein [Lacticaseibacillus pantheris]
MAPNTGVRSAGKLFEGVTIQAEELRDINGRYDMTARLNRNGLGGQTFSRHQYNTTDFADRPVVESTGPYIMQIHDSLRKLSLALYGESLNQRIEPVDQVGIRQAYREFRDLFLKLYEARVEAVEAEDKEV